MIKSEHLCNFSGDMVSCARCKREIAGDAYFVAGTGYLCEKHFDKLNKEEK